MKKFSYLKITAHSEIIFLEELTKQFCASIWQVFLKNSALIKNFCWIAAVWKLFLHGSWGNQISTWPKNLSNSNSLKTISSWVMWKSDLFSLVQLTISRSFWKCKEIFQWPSLIVTHTGISIFSLNNDIVRVAKIMINLVKDLKILRFKVIFQCLKLLEVFQKEILWRKCD